jgi:hypothetical protein
VCSCTDASAVYARACTADAVAATGDAAAVTATGVKLTGVAAARTGLLLALSVATPVVAPLLLRREGSRCAIDLRQRLAAFTTTCTFLPAALCSFASLSRSVCATRTHKQIKWQHQHELRQDNNGCATASTAAQRLRICVCGRLSTNYVTSKIHKALD